MREHIRTWKFTYAILGILFFMAFCGGSKGMAQERRETETFYGRIIICDDVSWIPRPCNADAPLPSFNGDAEKFTEWLLITQADVLEGQEEHIRQAIAEVMWTTGGLSYAVGYRDGLMKKEKKTGVNPHD